MKKYKQDLKTDIKHLEEAYGRLEDGYDRQNYVEFDYGLKMINDLIHYYKENYPEGKNKNTKE